MEACLGSFVASPPPVPVSFVPWQTNAWILLGELTEFSHRGRDIENFGHYRERWLALLSPYIWFHVLWLIQPHLWVTIYWRSSGLKSSALKNLDIQLKYLERVSCIASLAKLELNNCWLYLFSWKRALWLLNLLWFSTLYIARPSKILHGQELGCGYIFMTCPTWAAAY